MRLGCVVILALFAGAAVVSAVTPIEKVINLIEGLKKTVEDEGESEAKGYDEFACFCKSTTGAKSKSVNNGNDKIGSLSADIGDKTQQKEDDQSELVERQRKQEQHRKDLADTTARCAKQKAEYEAEEADLSKAIQGLEDAIKAMSDSAVFLQGGAAVPATVREAFKMADAMGLLKTDKHQAVAAFLQGSSSVDPNKPGYNFHSDDIINVCKDLLKEYKGSKKDLDDEWTKTAAACKATKASLNKKIDANKNAMDALKKNIDKLKMEVAKHREDLVISQSQMQDDEQYLKDLTARCEERANDYDQRSAMRNGELTAFTEALSVLTGRVQGRADAVNKRALLQTAKVEPVAKVVAPKEKVQATLKSISLLQEVASETKARTFLGLTLDARKRNAIDVLRGEGQRIHSVALSMLAERAAADPFQKVKGLIQKLIERMLEESKNEASKKGFCDTELGKARQDRDFRFQEAKDLSADLQSLEAKRDELSEEIKQLKRDIKDETQALKETTKDRKDEKEQNMKTLKTAKEGFEAVNEAILILKTFYKQAAKASFVQTAASPVDEDTGGAGFAGNYGGKQGSSKAIFALLETISSDFDRTIRTTEESENAAHRGYVEYSQAAEASLSGKAMKQELDEQDLETTLTSIKTKTDDMQTAVNLLDQALMELEELKPVCIDTGMSYKERVEKREEEIAALKRALCILDADNVEPMCKGGLQ